MVTHSEKLGLFADIKMIAQVLRVALVVESVYFFFHKLTDTVTCNFVFYINAAVEEHFSATVHGEENEGEVLDLEAVVIVAVTQR